MNKKGWLILCLFSSPSHDVIWEEDIFFFFMHSRLCYSSLQIDIPDWFLLLPYIWAQGPAALHLTWTWAPFIISTQTHTITQRHTPAHAHLFSHRAYEWSRHTKKYRKWSVVIVSRRIEVSRSVCTDKSPATGNLVRTQCYKPWLITQTLDKRAKIDQWLLVPAVHKL